MSLSAQQAEFLSRAENDATAAGHPFPRMAACEAALESGWGTSELASKGNNLFGMKQHSHPQYKTLNLPTREFEKGEWIEIEAGWVEYPSQEASFFDRLATLERLAPHYPHYKAAIEAQDPETYIREVSATWSTDPDRAEKVLAIYKQIEDAA